MARTGLSRAKLAKAWKNSYVQTIILAVILFGGVFSFWFGLRVGLNTEYPLLAVASGSMVPTLYRGDLILVQGVTDFAQLTVGYKNSQVPGEIIVYRVPLEFSYMLSDPNELIVHRAVSKEYNNNTNLWYFYTKGDASSDSSGHDPWNPIRQDYIIGKVIGKAPWIGYIPLFMREHPYEVFFIVAFLLVIFLVVDFVFPQRKKMEEEIKKETPE